MCAQCHILSQLALCAQVEDLFMYMNLIRARAALHTMQTCGWSAGFHGISEITAQLSSASRRTLHLEPALLAQLPAFTICKNHALTGDLVHRDLSQNSLWSQLRPQGRVPGGPGSGPALPWPLRGVFPFQSQREAAFQAPQRCKGSEELWNWLALPDSLTGSHAHACHRVIPALTLRLIFDVDS